MKDIIAMSLASYAITFVVSSSSLFEPVRRKVVKIAPWLRIGQNKHMIECRMCFGFWSSVLVCLCSLSLDMILPVYGFSYFLATQER